MTVEERARELCNAGDILWREGDRKRVEGKIAQMLRDQIEECAKVGDDHASRYRAGLCGAEGESIGFYEGQIEAAEWISQQIRALAEQKEKEKA